MMRFQQKGFVNLGIIAGALILVIGFLAEVAFPGLVLSNFNILGEPTSCLNKPYDWKCTCPRGTEKGSASPTVFQGFSCVLEISASDWAFPIETWEEAIAFAKSKGLDNCDPPAFYFNDISGPIALSNTGRAFVECREQGIGGRSVSLFEMIFDPNDGGIFWLSCNRERSNHCPPDINR